MDVFHALADPTRRRILELLAARGELSAAQIGAEFPVSPPAVSQHLKILREAGLVQVEKRAQQRIYRIDRRTVNSVDAWTGKLAQLWSRRFEALDALLEAEQQPLNDVQDGKEGLDGRKSSDEP